jgi:PhnB protein
MARTSLYLHFPGNAEEAFRFYQSIFKTEFDGPITRFGDLPSSGGEPLSAEDAKCIMRIALPILGGLIIAGNDTPASMGTLIPGNNLDIHLEPDTRAELDRLYAALSEGGKAEFPPQGMPGGVYWGTAVDRFGVQWMFSCAEKV